MTTPSTARQKRTALLGGPGRAVRVAVQVMGLTVSPHGRRRAGGQRRAWFVVEMPAVPLSRNMQILRVQSVRGMTRSGFILFMGRLLERRNSDEPETSVDLTRAAMQEQDLDDRYVRPRPTNVQRPRIFGAVGKATTRRVLTGGYVGFGSSLLTSTSDGVVLSSLQCLPERSRPGEDPSRCPSFAGP